MSKELQVAQVLGTLPNLTPEQETTLSSFDASSLEVAEVNAENTVGYDVARAMLMVSTSVNDKLFRSVRLVILGILSGDDSLTANWREVVGEFSDLAPDFEEDEPKIPFVEPVLPDQVFPVGAVIPTEPVIESILDDSTDTDTHAEIEIAGESLENLDISPDKVVPDAEPVVLAGDYDSNEPAVAQADPAAGAI